MIKGNKHPPPKRSAIHKMDVSRIICIHLLGETHTIHHRMGVGLVMMTFGVLVSEFTKGLYIIHIMGDLIGYGIHGIGTIPFGEALVSHVAGLKKKIPEFPDFEEEVESLEKK